MFACLYRPPAADGNAGSLEAIAQEFSPRYERYRPDLIAIDLRGLERLIGPPRVIAHELRREAADRGVLVHVAIARRHAAAVVLALACPGITLVDDGGEAAALAPIPVDVLEAVHDDRGPHRARGPAGSSSSLSALESASSIVSTLKQWGLERLGELAALQPGELAARLGQPGLAWQAIARGEDIHPLVPTRADERFEAALELDWPIEGREPLSFVLTRLLEPLSTRLERRDRGAAVLHVRLQLVTKATHARSLELPAPLRDVRTLRTLALLDLESHPPPAAIDGVTVVIDPTPGRVLQHALFTRAHPTPDQVSTLLARLGALMGQDRVGAPCLRDTYRPGAFAMKPFAVVQEAQEPHSRDRHEGAAGASSIRPPEAVAASSEVPSALRRFRIPVAARVTVLDGRPVRLGTDRRGLAGGSVVACAGPWRTSGNWWETGTGSASWDRDEWDVALSDASVYRLFRDRETDRWFIEARVD